MSQDERPPGDHRVNRPQVQAGKLVQLSGTNGQRLGRADHAPTERFAQKPVWLLTGRSWRPFGSRVFHASRDTIIPLRTPRGLRSLVGDHGVEETPVPIPNTEVKLASPMILLRGKVGYRRLLGPCWGNPAGPFFLRDHVVVIGAGVDWPRSAASRCASVGSWRRRVAWERWNSRGENVGQFHVRPSERQLSRAHRVRFCSMGPMTIRGKRPGR
jgi:hypothetical protein